MWIGEDVVLGLFPVWRGCGATWLCATPADRCAFWFRFVAVAYLATGKFVVSAFGMLLLVFMTDFAKIALTTDNVRWSRKPEIGNIGGFVAASAVIANFGYAAFCCLVVNDTLKIALLARFVPAAGVATARSV